MISIFFAHINFDMNVSIMKYFLADWSNKELSDLLLAYKHMVLGGIKKDNWKELSKRMIDMGWNRSNDHCRHQVRLHFYSLTDQFCHFAYN